MAVVFISPKQRQKMFFLAITIIFLLLVLAISLTVFLAQPKEVSPNLVFNRPKITIDMGIFDSDQFKNLEPFTEMQNQYSYVATTEQGRQQTGFITAASMDEARAILIALNLEIVELKEAQIGRENPFIPYYKEVAPPEPE